MPNQRCKAQLNGIVIADGAILYRSAQKFCREYVGFQPDWPLSFGAAPGQGRRHEVNDTALVRKNND